MHDTSVDSVDNGGLQLRDRNTEEQVHLPADLVIFTAGTEPNSLINSLPLSKDKYGRILTKRTLQTVDYPYIYALGDCSSVDDDSIPATAQVAMQQTSTAACNVVESIRHSRIYGESTESLSNSSSGNGTRVGDGAQIDGDTGDHTPHRPKLQEFRYFSLGEMLSLGDTNATITSLGGWVTLSGPVAALGRRAAYAFRMPTLGQTVTALISAGAVTSGKLLSQRFSSNEKE